MSIIEIADTLSSRHALTLFRIDDVVMSVVCRYNKFIGILYMRP